MQGTHLNEETKLLIRNVYNEFKKQLDVIYPDKEIYSYLDLMYWYNDNLPLYFNDVARQYNLQVRTKFDLVNRKLYVYNPGNTLRLMTINLNIRSKLKQANLNHFTIDRGFIFNKRGAEHA